MAVPATMTKDELKAALSQKGGISAPASAKKDELLALYEEHVVSNAKIAEFSADDETQGGEDQPIALKKRNSPRKPVVLDGGKLDDISKLSDDQLAEALINRGLEVGPIVDSTRNLYRKKLANCIKGVDNKLNGSDVANGDNEDNHNGTADFSADDEEVNGREVSGEEVEEEEEELETETEDEQPSVHVKKVSQKGLKSAEKSFGSTSPLTSLRQRFLGEGNQSKGTNGQRFTPTPRRSIHSYKVTETTTQTMTKNPDGSISQNIDYKKVTSEDNAVVGGSKVYAILKMLPGFFLLLIAIVLAYYIYSKRK